jgi:predicted  nucleic acid-binding Zn-ribbon protein
MATKKVNIDIIAKDKSKQALNRVRGNLDGVKKSVFNLRNAFIGLGAGLVIKNIIGVGKEIEGLQVRLKFLFGSMEEGNKAFDNMAKFASKVPFSLQQIQQGAGNLAVVSKNATELAKILEITGNVAAVTGLDFQTTASQIQRSFAGGIASADIFREKGVRSLLGFKEGAKTSVKDTIKAFEETFGKGGRFGSATDELAKTFEGTLSMIGDSIFNFKRILLKEGFFPELKKQFGDLDAFIKNEQEVLDEFARQIGMTLAKSVQTLADAMKFLHKNFDAVVTTAKIFIALYLANLFKNVASSIGLMTVAMMKFNIATKKNIALFIVGGLISGYVLLSEELKKLLGLKEEELKWVEKSSYAWNKLREKVAFNTEELKNYKDQLFDNIQSFKEHKKSIEAAHNQDTVNEFYQNLFRNVTSFVSQKRSMMKSVTDYDKKQLDEQLKNIQDFEAQKLTSSQAHHTKALTNTQDFLDQQDRAYHSYNQRQIFLANQTADLKKQANEEIFTNTKGTLMALSGLSRGAFEAYKKFQIAEATINAIMAASTAFKTYAANPWMAYAVAASAMVKGMAMVAQIKSTSYREQGGAVQKDKPYIVGEAGREMFVPNQSGNIVPNDQLGRAVNVNFNINTVDARGFNELLTNSRATIVGMINSAVNETGRQAII